MKRIVGQTVAELFTKACTQHPGKDIVHDKFGTLWIEDSDRWHAIVLTATNGMIVTPCEGERTLIMEDSLMQESILPEAKASRIKSLMVVNVP